MATIVLGALLDTTASASTSDAEVPAALKDRAECMYQVLTKMPGVSKPKIGYVISEGWNHPFVEYLVTERDGTYPRRFEAQKPRIDHNAGYWFLTTFYGPIPPGFDVNLMDSIMQTWKAQCRADVVVEIN